MFVFTLAVIAALFVYLFINLFLDKTLPTISFFFYRNSIEPSMYDDEELGGSEIVK